MRLDRSPRSPHLDRVPQGLACLESPRTSCATHGATLLNDEGVQLELIADTLGHTTTVMLQRHYPRRIRLSADAAVGTMDQLFGQA